MHWFVYAAGSAVTWGILSLLAKKIMNNDSNFNYTTLYSLLALIFYTPIFLYFAATTGINWTQAGLAALLGSIIGNLAAFAFYNGSIKNGELSKVIPFTKLAPIFTAVFAYFLIGETITYKLGAGILLSTAGSMVILKEHDVNYMESIGDGISQKAVKYAALSSVFYGFTSVMDRIATQAIQPEIYTYFIFLGMTTGYLAYGKQRGKTPHLYSSLKKQPILYVATGLLAAIGTYSIFNAFSQAAASKVMPVLHLQVLISVVGGVKMFDEEELLKKVIGSLILLTGVTLVAI